MAAQWIACVSLIFVVVTCDRDQDGSLRSSLRKINATTRGRSRRELTLGLDTLEDDAQLWRAFVEFDTRRANNKDQLRRVASIYDASPEELQTFMDTPMTFEEEADHLEKQFRLDHGAHFTPAMRENRLLDLLRVWHGLCDSNGLKYWLDSGTLMAVFRSHGERLIPWDPDADVVMPEADSKKLIKLAHSLGNGQVLGPALNLPQNMILVTKGFGESGDFHRADPRPEWLPIKLVDKDSGYYIDVFTAHGDASNFRLQVPFPWAHQQCDLGKCYDYARSDVYPLAQCRLAGVGDDLPCPSNTRSYLMNQFGSLSPDHHWDSQVAQFVKSS